MQNDYARFLAFRETQRQLNTKFERPRMLLLHVMAFVATVTAVWAYGTGARLWIHYDNLILPTVIGAVWSLLLAAHAVHHVRCSAASQAQRERAVEAEMHDLMQRKRGALDSDALFDIHRSLESDLEREGRWSAALTAFALVNALSWLVSLANPASSWPFQTTPIFAAVVIGGVQAYLVWQAQRAAGRENWFTRLPLWHLFAYPVGVILLWALGAYRAINTWDADTLIQLWSVALAAYALYCVAVRPPLRALRARFAQTQPPDKRKLGRDVALGDDGELVLLDADAASAHMAASEMTFVSMT